MCVEERLVGAASPGTDNAAADGRRDEAALWAEFAAPLRAFVRKRLPDAVDADDVLQEIFLRIARHSATLDEVEHLEGWIYRVARTALADALRAYQRRDARAGDVDTDALPDQSADAPESVLSELSPCLTPFVQRLEEPYRSAVEMTALGGLSQQEAAERAGISFSGMKSRVQRAREQLRRQLLRCCSVEVDARGGIMDYEVKDPSVCGPAGPAASEPACGGDGCAPEA